MKFVHQLLLILSFFLLTNCSLFKERKTSSLSDKDIKILEIQLGSYFDLPRFLQYFYQNTLDNKLKRLLYADLIVENSSYEGFFLVEGNNLDAVVVDKKWQKQPKSKVKGRLLFGQKATQKILEYQSYDKKDSGHLKIYHSEIRDVPFFIFFQEYKRIREENKDKLLEIQFNYSLANQNVEGKIIINHQNFPKVAMLKLSDQKNNLLEKFKGKKAIKTFSSHLILENLQEGHIEFFLHSKYNLGKVIKKSKKKFIEYFSHIQTVQGKKELNIDEFNFWIMKSSRIIDETKKEKIINNQNKNLKTQITGNLTAYPSYDILTFIHYFEIPLKGSSSLRIKDSTRRIYAKFIFDQNKLLQYSAMKEVPQNFSSNNDDSIDEDVEYIEEILNPDNIKDSSSPIKEDPHLQYANPKSIYEYMHEYNDLKDIKLTSYGETNYFKLTVNTENNSDTKKEHFDREMRQEHHVDRIFLNFIRSLDNRD